jgi:hypothetical protein
MTIIRIQAKSAMLAAVAVCAFLLTGCGGHSPQNAADTYLSNLKFYNYPATYQALSHQDQVDRTMDQFLTEIPMAPDVSRDWFKGILRTYDFKVGDAKIDGDKAVVTVSVTRPDLALWERTVDAGLSGDQTPDSIAQKNLTDNTYPKVTYDDNIVMVQQGGEWRVLVDFPFKENIVKEHKDAVDLYHKHDYDKAIAAYQKILDELDKEQRGAQVPVWTRAGGYTERAEAAARRAGVHSENRAERCRYEDVGVASAGDFRQDDE